MLGTIVRSWPHGTLYTGAVADVKRSNALRRQRRLRDAALATPRRDRSHCCAAEEGIESCRKVVRSERNWRSSTLYGYVFRPDDQTSRLKFRMSKPAFHDLVVMLERTPVYNKEGRSLVSRADAAHKRSVIPLAFKVGACI